MSDEANPVKEILYGYISKITETKIEILVSHGKGNDIISEIISNCYPKIVKLEGDQDENIGKLAESLMHFLLQAALISSQRKITKENTDIDIIIPDMKTLNHKPENTLVIYFPKTSNKEIIQKKLDELQIIQPNKENIWIIVSQKMDLEYKTYIINHTFKNILNDITEFQSNKNQNKFKIFKTS